MNNTIQSANNVKFLLDFSASELSDNFNHFYKWLESGNNKTLFINTMKECIKIVLSTNNNKNDINSLNSLVLDKFIPAIYKQLSLNQKKTIPPPSDFDYNKFTNWNPQIKSTPLDSQQPSQSTQLSLTPSKSPQSQINNKHFKTYLISHNDVNIDEDGFYVFDMSLKNIFSFKCNWFKCSQIHNINTNNNTFTIVDNQNLMHHITIPHGYYSILQLLDTLSSIFKDLNLDFITFTYLTNINKIKISSSINFSLIWSSNLNYSLGFLNKDYLNSNTYISEDNPQLNFTELFAVNKLPTFNYNIFKKFNYMLLKHLDEPALNSLHTKDSYSFNPIDISSFKFKFIYVTENNSFSLNNIIHPHFLLSISFEIC